MIHQKPVRLISILTSDNQEDSILLQSHKTNRSLDPFKIFLRVSEWKKGAKYLWKGAVLGKNTPKVWSWKPPMSSVSFLVCFVTFFWSIGLTAIYNRITVVWDAVNFKILYFAESDMINKFGFKSFKFRFFPFFSYYIITYYRLKNLILMQLK